jgi:hypothetical protein
MYPGQPYKYFEFIYHRISCLMHIPNRQLRVNGKTQQRQRLEYTISKPASYAPRTTFPGNIQDGMQETAGIFGGSSNTNQPAPLEVLAARYGVRGLVLEADLDLFLRRRDDGVLGWALEARELGDGALDDG